MMNAQEIVNEAFEAPDVDTNSWGDISRWINETVTWMYIPTGTQGDPFDDSAQRRNLRFEALVLAYERYIGVNPHPEGE